MGLNALKAKTNLRECNLALTPVNMSHVARILGRHDMGSLSMLHRSRRFVFTVRNRLGRPLGYLIFSLMALIRDPIY